MRCDCHLVLCLWQWHTVITFVTQCLIHVLGQRVKTHTHTRVYRFTYSRKMTDFLFDFFFFRAFFFRLYIFSKCAFVAERNNVIRLIVGVSQYLWCYYCSWLSFNARKMGFLTVYIHDYVYVYVFEHVNVCLREQIRKRKIERRRRRGLKLP